MKRDDDLTGAGAIALLVLVVLCCALDACWNQHVYGDWTCAWSKCVRVKP